MQTKNIVMRTIVNPIVRCAAMRDQHKYVWILYNATNAQVPILTLVDELKDVVHTNETTNEFA